MNKSIAFMVLIPTVTWAGIHVQQNDSNITIGSMTLTNQSGIQFKDASIQTTAFSTTSVILNTSTPQTNSPVFNVSSGTTGSFFATSQELFSKGAGHNTLLTTYRDVGTSVGQIGYDNSSSEGLVLRDGGGTDLLHCRPDTAQCTVAHEMVASSLTVSGTGAGEIDLTEGASPSGQGSKTVTWADSTAHWPQFIPNNGQSYQFVGSSAAITTGHMAGFSAQGSVIDIGAPSSGGGGTPSGSSGQMQYNSAGSFAGAANSVITASSFTYNGPVLADTATLTTFLKIGGGSLRGSNPAADIARTVGVQGGHGWHDSSAITGNSTTGYNPFANFISLNGVGPYEHTVGFQSAPSYASTSTISYMYDFLSQTSFDNSGNASVHAGFVMGNPTINSTGRPSTEIGFYVPAELTAGSGSNFAFYTPAHQNYMQGLILGNADTYYTGSTLPMLMINAPNNADALIRLFEKDQNIWDIAAVGSTSRFDIRDQNATPYFSILTGGKIGIGTTHPGSTLEVNGDETIDSSATIKGAGGLGATYGVVAGTFTANSGVAFTQTYKAAICQSGTASLGFSAFTSSAPTTSCLISTSTVMGIAAFVKTSTMSVQDHFLLPTDWVGAVNANIVWTSSVTTNNAFWQIRTGCSADGESPTTTWNAFSTVADTAKANANVLNTASVTGISTSNCSAGKEMFFELMRDPFNASDTLLGAANLVTLQITLRRTLGL